MDNDSKSDDDLIREFEDLLEGGFDDDPDRLMEQLQPILRRINRSVEETIEMFRRRLVENIEVIDDSLDSIAADEQTPAKAAKQKCLQSVEANLREMLFPSERRVADYHCPPSFIVDPDGITDLLNRTKESFNPIESHLWTSRDSGFLCRAVPHVYAANFILRSKSLHCRKELPQALDMLLTSRDCERVTVPELDFIAVRFAFDEEVLDLVRSVRQLQEQKLNAVTEKRFDDGARCRDAYNRQYARLNTICIERETTDA